MTRNARLSFVVILIVSLVLIALACTKEKTENATSTSPEPQAALGARALAVPAYAISIPPPGFPTFPQDTPVPAPTATLQQAAAFAWNEFITATWPAQPAAGNTFNRDVPDPNGIYGATAGSPTGAPLDVLTM